MLRLIHERTHSAKPGAFELPRFRILKPGQYTRMAIQASADAGGWDYAGRLDLIAAVDISRIEVIARSVSIPLNQEALLIEIKDSEYPEGLRCLYLAFKAYAGRRSSLAKIRLKIWAEEWDPF